MARAHLVSLLRKGTKEPDLGQTFVTLLQQGAPLVQLRLHFLGTSLRVQSERHEAKERTYVDDLGVVGLH
jgi:hypothetical protein